MALKLKQPPFLSSFALLLKDENNFPELPRFENWQAKAKAFLHCVFSVRLRLQFFLVYIDSK